MLAKYKAGNYVPDDVICYDETEIEEFGRLLSSLVYAPSKLRKKLQSFGATITRSDFYSEIPTIADLEQSFEQPSKLQLTYPFRETNFLQEFLQDLTKFSEDFDPPVTTSREDIFAWESGAFGYSDAVAYYAMIRKFRPKTIIEIGCGASTLIASLACERNGIGKIIAIEPFPASFLHNLAHVELIERRAQDLDEGFINNSLDDGDMLFIDTTHTIRHDSDCLHIYLRILPAVSRDIFVHVHDIYLPDSLPLEMMRDRQLFWNEQYLLYAYMLENLRTRLLYSSAYHYKNNRELLKGLMHNRYVPGGGSIWFSQLKNTR
jgi:predicted O-methyltransferase YrrM